MTRTLIGSLLAVAVAVAAPVPKKPTKDYQKLAEETEWQFGEFNFEGTIATEFKGYEVTVTAGGGRNDVDVRVSKGGKELFHLTTHWQAVVRQNNGVVYYTEYSPWSSGCSLVAFDLKAKKELWKCGLKGLGPIDHSKYRNEVRMEVLDGDTIQVFSKESSGRYVEIVDRHAGKTVGHKVFTGEKK